MPLSDEELVREYLSGEEIAFHRLVERYLASIYTFTFRLCGNSEDAQDITQETFLKVWKKLTSFDQDMSFKTWVFSIARNTTFDYLRKKKQILFSELDRENEVFELTIQDTAALPEEVFAQKESEERIEQALKELSPEYRSIVLLHNNDGLTFEAISKIAGKPMNTVKSQYRRALIQMRTFLE